MKISEIVLENCSIQYPLERLCPLEKVLFFDIETTGFTARTSDLYLIGCAFYSEDSWRIIQWFAESPADQAQILTEFFEFSKNYETLLHFNGNNFDLPYVNQKCEMLSLPFQFDHLSGIDLFRRVNPYKFLLKLPNCKQKSIEKFLGIEREDIYSGGDLIALYKEYVEDPDEDKLHTLLLHNSDDVKGMLEILPILSYDDLFNQPLKAKKVQANYYKDVTGAVRKELIIHAQIETPLPQPITALVNDCYFRGEGSAAIIKVPILEEELKYFYANYKDYYYLPAEDIALHRSVSGFVDKEYRIPATASNCYTRKFSDYLPQWGLVFEPFFKRDYKSKQLYFELTDEFKKDREAFSVYATHILAMIASTY